MSERDPRIDPQPGDMLRKGEAEVRVTIVIGEWIFYKVVHRRKIRETVLRHWQTWANDAEVIR